MKLTEAECKKRLLNLLIEFDKICKENNIQYSLAYGTLIGAVRHHGYIPWDDDIDVMMTKENYKKFLSLEIENDKFYTLDNRNKNYHLMYSKFVDKQTKLIYSFEQRFEENTGLFLDIFPIEYIGENEKESIKTIKSIQFLNALLSARRWKHFFRNKDYGFKRQLIRFAFYIMSRFVKPKKIIKKLQKKVSSKPTLYMGYPYTTLLKRGFNKKIFANYLNIEFEKHLFSVIADYDIFLKDIYGDYMQLPPIEKRNAKHEYEAFLI